MQNQRISDIMAESELKNILSASTVITGEIKGQGDLSLDGQLTGNIDINGLLFVGKKGNFNGEAAAENMVIEGRVEGQIKANIKIEIRSSGHVLGNVICQQIVIAEGAFLDGKVKTKKGKPLNPEYFVEKRKELLTEQD
ncbi:MAG: polymer-forming cytoskeletal protein [Candidatus Aminicenantes bacterium]|nr:polymer-forming cytoskeletal protein [Candidatus Aminicenantes bacterium]